MITAWRIPPQSLPSFSVSGHHPTWICGLKKVNIFIGRNNSGKSRVLRGLFSSFSNDFICEKITPDENGYDFINKDPSLREILIGAISASQDIRIDAGSRSEIKELKNAQENLQKILHNKGQVPIEEIIIFYSCCVNAAKIFNELTGDIRDSAIRIANKVGTGAIEETINFTNCLRRVSGSEAYALPKIYIPVLRSAKLSGLGADRSSEDQIIKHHFSDAERRTELREYIFTGQSFYGDILDLKGGDRLKRRKLEGYEEYISKTFLDGESIAITPRSDLDRVVSIEIADKFENEIYNIGDGIHHILLMTFPLICKFTGGCVFIEEPELYLHPGLLRQLIQTLLSDARYSQYQFFISTHSNHLVDKAIESANIATFKLSKTTTGDTQKFLIERSSGSDLGILADLGVNASSVFLSNCTIWVEGITDRLYIAHMMKLLLQEQNETFLEGIHYAFVEYGGANITHWSFGESEAELNQPIDRIDALSISSKILLISDNNETPSGALKSRRESLERQLGDRYINLECKEIENLISWSVLKSVLIADGETVSSEFQYDQYKHVYLGGFIHEQVLPESRNKIWMEGIPGSANPIKGKVDFCKKSINAMKASSDLSEYAKIVCLRIIDFVRSCN